MSTLLYPYTSWEITSGPQRASYSAREAQGLKPMFNAHRYLHPCNINTPGPPCHQTLRSPRAHYFKVRRPLLLPLARARARSQIRYRMPLTAKGWARKRERQAVCSLSIHAPGPLCDMA